MNAVGDFFLLGVLLYAFAKRKKPIHAIRFSYAYTCYEVKNMQLSVCVDALFSGKDFYDSLELLHKNGFDKVEFWAWWKKDVDRIKLIVEKNGMTVTALCTKFISLVDPAYREDYLAGLKESVDVAKKLGCKRIISQVGNDTGEDRTIQAQSLTEGLIEAAKLLEGTDIVLVVEPLNTLVDHPGYFLVRSDEAFDIIDRVSSEHIKILFDIYHQQISEGNVVTNIVNNIEKIAHFHSAGSFGRHELDNGELNYGYVIKKIEETDYNGFFGVEYFPENDPIKGLLKLNEIIKTKAP